MLEAMPIQAVKAARMKVNSKKPPDEKSVSLSIISNWGPIRERETATARREKVSHTSHCLRTVGAGLEGFTSATSLSTKSRWDSGRVLLHISEPTRQAEISYAVF